MVLPLASGEGNNNIMWPGCLELIIIGKETIRSIDGIIMSQMSMSILVYKCSSETLSL